MSVVIEKFYRDNKLPEAMIRARVATFTQNPDIAKEFEHWIENRAFSQDHAVCVEGYTAAKLAEASEYLNGDGAFIILIELRENPENALRKMKNSLKRK